MPINYSISGIPSGITGSLMCTFSPGKCCLCFRVAETEVIQSETGLFGFLRRFLLLSRRNSLKAFFNDMMIAP